MRVKINMDDKEKAILMALQAAIFRDIIQHGRERKWKDEFIVDLIIDQCNQFTKGHDRACRAFVKENSLFKRNDIK